MFGPKYSSDNSGDGPTTNQKEKKRRRDALGEKKLKESYQKQKRNREEISSRKYLKDKSVSSDVALDPTRLSDDQFEDLFVGLKSCCIRGEKSEKGCFLEMFKTAPGQFDKTSAYEFCREIRAKTNKKQSLEDKEVLIQNLVKSGSVLDQRTNKWKHDFVLKYNSRIHKVCMKTFAEIHGFTLYAFIEASRRLKNFKIGDPFAKVNDTEIVRPLGDKFVHDLCFNDVLDIADENVPGGMTGNQSN